MSDIVGMMWAHLEKQLTTTMMASYPWLHGSSMMRLTKMICQRWSGTLLGISCPVGLRVIAQVTTFHILHYVAAHTRPPEAAHY